MACVSIGRIEADVPSSILSKQGTKDAAHQHKHHDKHLKEAEIPCRHREPSNAAAKAKIDQSTANHQEQPATELL